MLLDTSDQGILVNSWLLAPEVSGPYRNGHLQVQPYGMNWDMFDEAAAADEGASEARVCGLNDHLPDTQSVNDHNFLVHIPAALS
jgi:hypothetical protein